MSQRGCAATSAGFGAALGEDDSFKSTSELLRDSFKRHLPRSIPQHLPRQRCAIIAALVLVVCILSLTLDNATTAYLRAAGCAAVDPQQYDGGMYFYSNVIGGWNGLFRSPQMRSYASFWWNWDGGWLHRWSDQQFWAHALYVTNATRIGRVRHDGVVVGGDVISLEHHRQHREFVHTGGR